MLHLSKSTIGNIVIRYKNKIEQKVIHKEANRKNYMSEKKGSYYGWVKNNPRISAPKLTSEIWERFDKKLNPETAKYYQKNRVQWQNNKKKAIYKRREQKEETSMRKRIR